MILRSGVTPQLLTFQGLWQILSSVVVPSTFLSLLRLDGRTCLISQAQHASSKAKTVSIGKRLYDAQNDFAVLKLSCVNNDDLTGYFWFCNKFEKIWQHDLYSAFLLNILALKCWVIFRENTQKSIKIRSIYFIRN